MAAKGPLILASNHPSAFLEASILSTVMKRPIHFLVRGDMFNPRFRWLFNWTKQIPIYRQKDGISNLRKNASSFDLTYKKLSEGEAVLIFPEAKTVLEKKMRPIQRGTAHLAFGTTPYLKGEEKIIVQPVGVNFTEPRLPGTDVIVKFGEPFISPNASREDRDAIEEFTRVLSDSMDPLIIQVDDAREKNYDVLASIYLRMIYENIAGSDAYGSLRKIAGYVNQASLMSGEMKTTQEILKSLREDKLEAAAYFPDLIIMNRVGLAMMTFLKCLWVIAGGWIWRLVRLAIYNKIKSDTFQSPTTIGIFMVVMPLVTIILLIVFLIVGVPFYYVLIWLLIMWMGTVIRPSLNVITKILVMQGKTKKSLKGYVLDLRTQIENIIHSQ